MRDGRLTLTLTAGIYLTCRLFGHAVDKSFVTLEKSQRRS